MPTESGRTGVAIIDRDLRDSNTSVELPDCVPHLEQGAHVWLNNLVLKDLEDAIQAEATEIVTAQGLVLRVAGTRNPEDDEQNVRYRTCGPNRKTIY
jgi:hypothetical protein